MSRIEHCIKHCIEHRTPCRAGFTTLFAALLLGATFIGRQVLAQDSTAATDAHVLLTHDLPHMDGRHLALTVVEVSYGPGESSPPHTHGCPVVGYVIDGAFRTQLRGGPETIYTAGQTFYEPANSAHIVSANASTEVPVHFLAYFTCDHKAPLTTALPEASHPQVSHPQVSHPGAR